MSKTTIIATASALGGLLLGACIFKKAEGGPSPVQLLQLLAQATNCWISSGGSVTTACSVGVGGATADANTKLAVNGRISSSVLGVYCGKTTGTFNGAQVGGFGGAKSLCATACDNTNAHMCTAHEISISLQLGISVPGQGWMSTFVLFDSGPNANTECSNWSSGGDMPPLFVPTRM